MTARLRVQLDLNDAFAPASGAGGLPVEDLPAMLPRLDAVLEEVREEHRRGAHAYLALPEDRAARRESVALAEELRASFENLVVLGIGGSSLGARAVFSALAHPFHNSLPAGRRPGMRLFLPDNSDPVSFSALLETLPLERTAFAAVTKSGGTAETMSQLSIVKERLERDLGAGAFARHVVAITDPARGALRAIASREGLRTLPVPPAVGGRFSVLTACGLLPAACAGIDVEALCGGAAAMVQRFAAPAAGNPAALLAGVLHSMDTRRRRPIHVLMPYADALREVGDWFVQLWAESLGKPGREGPVGPTPMRAVGATDQHSLLQLLMEGPQDKMVVFVAVTEPRVDLAIPAAFPEHADVAYLAGATLGSLLAAERRATAIALARSGRPSATLTLPALDAWHVGELLLLLEQATTVAGKLYGIDPYDQPGVELGKRYTCGMLGRPGYDDAAREIASLPSRNSALILS